MSWDPVWAVLDLTYRCDLACRHCSARAHSRAPMAPLDAREWFAIVDELGEEGCRHVTLSGGEPLLRGDFFEIAAHCRQRGLEVTVATNGQALDGDAVARLRDAALDGIQVSVDGLQRVHDSLRGDGTFRRALRAVGRLARAGIPVSTMTVLSTASAPDLRKLARTLRDAGARYMSFERLTLAGRAHALERLLLAPQALRAVLEELHALSRELPIAVNDPLRLPFRPDLWHLRDRPYACGGCLAGIATCAISATGELKLCTRLDYVLGSLRELRLRELWDRDDVALRLRTREGLGRCSSCPDAFLCGGCRAEAQQSGRGMFDTDPGCWINEPCS